MKKILLILAIGVSFISCTDNNRARKWGGKEEIKLPENCSLINTTWKENSLWILIKNNQTGQFQFIEKSPYGIMEGEVTFLNPESIERDTLYWKQ